ncbi:hypothetical protein EPIR_2969 [Erwinia piriflorinigrans CFBP 5888]|uniref:Uncharacterized protein n=1 Tax=Erwinia piriflorinigrans CFBP 5888 TaxID=1161919 RepID=V5ZBD1_9GAMM|nr:hypothetical protein EPIR_2969 [Erwinia piriflorinigrans CFBP 5888]
MPDHNGGFETVNDSKSRPNGQKQQFLQDKPCEKWYLS